MKEHKRAFTNVVGQKVEHVTSVWKESPFEVRIWHEIIVEGRHFHEEFVDINKSIWESVGREMGWM